jgi:hypothetical protein
MTTTDAVVPHGAKTYSAKAHAAVRIDIVEHDRRAAVGLGALNRSVINAMFSLPLGHLVRWDDLAPNLGKLLNAAPTGIVECSSYGVRRLCQPPVTVDLAVVTGRPWTAGLSAASSFAGYCRRVLLLDQRRRIPRDKLWEADYYGIGVWTDDGDGIEELVTPAPWRQLYSNPAGWWFRERAYDAWLGATGQRPIAGPPDLFGPGGIKQESPVLVADGLDSIREMIETMGRCRS